MALSGTRQKEHLPQMRICKKKFSPAGMKPHNMKSNVELLDKFIDGGLLLSRQFHDLDLSQHGKAPGEMG